jgi:hypothetical protein
MPYIKTQGDALGWQLLAFQAVLHRLPVLCRFFFMAM